MASSVRAAAINWSKLNVTLPQETVVSLQAFRKRNEEVKRALSELKEQSTSVDFAHYRKVLKNQNIIDQAEKAVNSFKPVSYNLDAQLNVINQFESKAVAKAEKTVKQIEQELKELQATLSNIQQSRPVEQLKVDDVVAANPKLIKEVEESIKKGEWSVPGYKEKFGDISYF
ncbi:hypothetical protein G6F57_003124 [Rhizopus arrhizus]|uniref:ATP synthase subunit d, mitochondrial n=3 Tax=Rhizopus TaxID=4842 RepID=I1BKR1_RHIO9|nr:hypothetical protein RO3G_01495 [Rhizopus delemar RA 99-880]KAG0757911.1 hypothetical protein G6F24_010165 [Rhizopus arrhizus]KAG1466940.1 hypothetical protein G6F55_000142 [Rhizopus delemar]KAG0784044.1 hypothetical protein G6F21_010157 [Rhizopus arrhizus]KAG0811035.1 hypothetical protein G6F20_007479 [Rhizopus arrhizus]|eukprot:EIE76791.1 hypothetical protein RO3G_01495 [Rhizopus delemar RA 99-880]